MVKRKTGEIRIRLDILPVETEKAWERDYLFSSLA